jgi:PKD repeat protein
MRLNQSLCGAATASALLVSLSQAQGLAAVGPTSPDHGFPENYVDNNGLSLDLCLTDPVLCLLDGAVSLSSPGSAFPANYGGTFPEEAFWNVCEAIIPTNNGGQALLVIALEAAFGNEVVEAGQQVAFARVRVRVDNLVSGATYTVTTPVGTFVFVAEGAGVRGINFTDDVGIAPGVFTGALGGAIGPFLQWDTGLPILDAAGREYIGNPSIDHTITGSPFGTNFFRIAGPSVGGAGVNSIETNLFGVLGLKSGAIEPPPPVEPVANFNSAPNSGTAPLNVAFSDTSTGTVTAWSWSFGDAGTSALQNPSHSYAAGTFSVSLTVTGPGGSNTLTKPNLVVVTEPPVGGNLVVALPVPGIAGVPNTLTVTGATPGRTVGIFTGLVLGAGVVNQGNCGGIPIGLARPFRLAGRANANAGGVAVVTVNPPAGSAGRLFHFQAVEPASCRVSNIVSDVL